MKIRKVDPRTQGERVERAGGAALPGAHPASTHRRGNREAKKPKKAPATPVPNVPAAPGRPTLRPA